MFLTTETLFKHDIILNNDSMTILTYDRSTSVIIVNPCLSHSLVAAVSPRLSPVKFISIQVRLLSGS